MWVRLDFICLLCVMDIDKDKLHTIKCVEIIIEYIIKNKREPNKEWIIYWKLKEPLPKKEEIKETS